jgi:hypothetical protein
LIPIVTSGPRPAWPTFADFTIFALVSSVVISDRRIFEVDWIKALIWRVGVMPHILLCDYVNLWERRQDPVLRRGSTHSTIAGDHRGDGYAKLRLSKDRLLSLSNSTRLNW